VSQHSQLVGGSTVDRLLNCHASYQYILKLPPQPESVSAFAEEGSFGHAVMDIVASRRANAPTTRMADLAHELLGEHVYDREVTEKHLDELIYPAIEALEALEGIYGGGFKVVAVEAKVRFPGVPAFGTADLILQSKTHVLLADYKFGVGVVTALYVDDTGERTNPQLMFYLAAARNTKPALFKKRQPVIAIIQPRAEVPLTHAQVQEDEILWFIQDVELAVDKALGHNPQPHRGDHCKYCPAKPICPAWVGPIRELAKLAPLAARTAAVTRAPTQYAQHLAMAKTLSEDLLAFAKEVDVQLKAYLEDGGYVPGYTLQAKKKLRQWADEDDVNSELDRLGFKHHEIWASKLVTFAAADKTAKRLGVKIPDHLRVVPPTDETVVVRTDEAIAPIERPLLVEQLAASAAKLSRKGEVA